MQRNNFKFRKDEMKKPKSSGTSKVDAPADVAPHDRFEISQGDRTQPQVLATLAAEPQFINAFTSRVYLQPAVGEMDIGTYVNSVREQVKEVQNGDLKGVEAMLMSQAVALNGIFQEMARRAALNIGQHMDATETYMRLAIKAQNNCRATLQTLGEIKNPRQPVAFIKQANMANGPQQIVNHGTAAEPVAHGENQNHSNELGAGDGGKVLELGAADGTGGIDPPLEAMAKLDRAKVGAGKGSGGKEQPKARRTVSAVH
jgi:hypothetical protein